MKVPRIAKDITVDNDTSNQAIDSISRLDGYSVFSVNVIILVLRFELFAAIFADDY